MVETSKAVSFRLYELDKLLTDNSKFHDYFQYVILCNRFYIIILLKLQQYVKAFHNSPK
jgi:hypothetical protein